MGTAAVRRDRIGRIFLILIMSALVSACFAVRLVPPYDEQIDQGLTELYADTSTFVDRMVSLSGQPEGRYTANQEFYSDAIGRVDSLIARARGNQVLNNCPSTALMTRVLDAANLSAELRNQVGNIPEGACQIVLLENLRRNFEDFRSVHRNQGDAGLTPFLRDQIMEGGVGSLLRTAIMVEVAKRGSSGSGDE